VAQRQHLDGNADLQAARARGNKSFQITSIRNSERNNYGEQN
jgi:hypothetical protein